MARSRKESLAVGVPYDIFLARLDKATELLLRALDDVKTSNSQAHEDLQQADLKQQEAHTVLVKVVTDHIIQTTADIRELKTRQNWLTGANGIFTLVINALGQFRWGGPQ